MSLSDIVGKATNADKAGTTMPRMRADAIQILVTPEERAKVQEMAKQNFSAQRINEILWEQAVIIPIGHFAFGVWVKGRFDLSMLNPTPPPIEFNWLGFAK